LDEVLESLAVKIVVLAETDSKLSLSTEALLQAHRSDVEFIDGIEMYQRLKFRVPDDFIKNEGWFLQTKGFARVWNVLRGELSLVGPRPERPEFVGELKKEVPYYALRHFVRPGLTGWAQINYPYCGFDKRCES